MGRPRSEEARCAAVEATLDLLVEAGIEAVTFDEVSSRSGVAKSTLYRHFGSKQAMVVEAVRSCHVALPTPDSGDLVRDLLELVSRGTGADEERRIPDVMVNVLAASFRDDELRALVTAMLDEWRRPLRTVLRLAQARGELPADLDLDVALTLLVGPFTQRRLVDAQPVTPDFAEAVVRHAVAALGATAPVAG